MYLTYAAIVVVGSCINAVAVAALPFITHMLVGIINSTTVFILVALLVKSSPKQSASFVFSTFINETGWSSDGLVFFLGLLPSIASVTLYDGACHMTDEIDKPEVHIPWVMVLSNTSSAILGLVAAIIYMFCTKNVDTLSSPIGGQPIVQLMMDAFESNALTTVGVVALIMSFVGSSFTYYTTTSRLFWSFARSNGLPFGDIFAAVNSTLKVPVNAVGLVTALCLILGLIILGSSSALTAVLGSSMVCINLSYIFPIGALLWRSGFSRNIRTRYADGPDVLSMMVVDPKTALPYFHLGKFGVVLNVASVVWVCFIMVWLNFPTVHPVQSGTMNYACVVLGSTAVVGVIFWFAARKKYDHDVNGKHRIFDKRLIGFVYAFQIVLLGFSSGNSYAFGKYILYSINGDLGNESSLNNFYVKAIGVLCISYCTYLHIFHHHQSNIFFIFLGVSKILILLLIIVCGALVFVGAIDLPQTHNFSHMFVSDSPPNYYSISVALLEIIYSFKGWENVNYVLSETRDPYKVLTRSAPLAVLITTVLYFLVILSYLVVIPKQEIMSSGVLIAGIFFNKIFGQNITSRVLPLLIAVSNFGNVLVVSYAHSVVNKELSIENLLPFSKTFTRFSNALLLHWLVTVVVLVLPPSAEIYEFIVNLYIYPGTWINILLTGGLLYLRYFDPTWSAEHSEFDHLLAPKTTRLAQPATMSEEYMSSSLSSSSLMEVNYTLALKFFMSKDLSKSFDILRKEYPQLFSRVLSGVISEPVFVKVLNLYLTEVGLVLQSKHEFKVSKAERQNILVQLNDDYILSQLVLIYHDVNQIPSEVLYNLYLIYYIGLDLPTVNTKITQLYAKLRFSPTTPDTHLKKLVELIALRVLPELQLYQDARLLIAENPLLVDKEIYLNRVAEMEKDKAKEKDQKERNKQNQVREQSQREHQQKLDKDLKYRSLKQIREQQSTTDGVSVSKPSRGTGSDLNTLKDKLLYNLNFSRKWLKDNSPMILFVLIVVIIGNRFLRAKKIDVVKNVKETLKMAFKISYL
ncbi:hypothetical protein PSN45_000304 [Yamadazyma tenuis]|nr:hypothetical protein PSN45_000304 [Yamadazyma tenuis]